MQQDATCRDVDERKFSDMAAEWSRLTNVENPVPRWESRLLSMQSEMWALKRESRWRSGGRTLMHALGVKDNEVLLCRGLAWLLTPDGWHGLGAGFLVRFLHRLGLQSDGAADATVVTEEARDDCRADIVIRAGTAVVVIEAKVLADEEQRQADRLARAYSEMEPKLVFLTRDGRTPVTAVDSRGQWCPLAWTDLATLLDEAVAQSADCAPGVHDFRQTLHHYER